VIKNTYIYPKILKNPRVRMRDLSIKNIKKKNVYEKAFKRVINHGQFILGKEVESFEENICKIINSKYAVGVSSASSGLLLALKTSNIAKDDEIITTPMSWLVSSSVIKMVGAKPIFIDVDQDFNLDPNLISKKINSKTRAVLVVHYYGKIAQINEIKKICTMNNLLLIEDCAQAFGAKIKNGYAGSFGDFGVFSFGPMKVHGGIGDAGVIVCNNKNYYKKLISLRQCGTIKNEIAIYPEIKHTLDALHAAILNENLKIFKKTRKNRIKIGQQYIKCLNKYFKCPSFKDYNHSFYDFTIMVENRSELIKYMYKNGIEIKIRHPHLINEQNIFNQKVYLPMAKKYVKKIVQLPMHDNLKKKEISLVIKKLINFANMKT
jgi:dTDP-4-amino-4,6-dideoxygalactose transaminase